MNKGIQEKEFWELIEPDKFNLSLDNENYDDLEKFAELYYNKGLQASHLALREEIEKLKFIPLGEVRNYRKEVLSILNQEKTNGKEN